GRRLSKCRSKSALLLAGVRGQVANFVPTLSRGASPAKSRSHLDAVSAVGELRSDPDRVSGHLNLRKGKRGDVFYAKYRLPDGRQGAAAPGAGVDEGGAAATGLLHTTHRRARAGRDPDR